MKTSQATLLVILSFIVLFGCNTLSEKQQADNLDAKDNTNVERMISSLAAEKTAIDSVKKFIRKADIKTEVTSVVQSTYDIENKTRMLGGYVTYTQMISTILEESTTATSADSVVVSKDYQVENKMVLRVPDNHLDSLLNAVSPNFRYINYRLITAEDVTLQLMANNLSQKRLQKYAGRINELSDKGTKKMADALQAENDASEKELLSDNNKIANLDIRDKIKYSTVELNIYQPVINEKKLVGNPAANSNYKPSFGYQLGLSLHAGWDMLAGIILAATRLWSLILIFFLGVVLFKWIKRTGFRIAVK